jgi:hypothetical protein
MHLKTEIMIQNTRTHNQNHSLPSFLFVGTGCRTQNQKSSVEVSSQLFPLAFNRKRTPKNSRRKEVDYVFSLTINVHKRDEAHSR